MNITFAASEGVPFSKTGGLADVVGALPRALVALGHNVTVFLPRYKQTRLDDAKMHPITLVMHQVWACSRRAMVATSPLARSRTNYGRRRANG